MSLDSTHAPGYGRSGKSPQSHERLWAVLDGVGAGEMNRTPDLLITNELLYRLSYTGYRQNRSCDPAKDMILHTHLCKKYVQKQLKISLKIDSKTA